MQFLTEFRDRWRSRKFRNNGHACTSIVVQINTDDEKDGFELFTGTMMYFRVLGPFFANLHSKVRVPGYMYPGTPTMTLSEESFDSDSTVRVKFRLSSQRARIYRYCSSTVGSPRGHSTYLGVLRYLNVWVVGVQLPIHGARNSVLQI